jgi:hypothetical protein
MTRQDLIDDVRGTGRRVRREDIQMDFIERCAMVAHEVNRAYCESLGDYSQKAWCDAPEWQRASAMNGVRFHLGNPSAGAAASHDNWLTEKQRDGWKWGTVKDEAKKEHPCFVRFDDLPQEQKAKDFLFRAVVHAMTAAG